MYNYMLNNEKNKVVVSDEENQIVCEANVVTNRNDVLLSSINLHTTNIDNALLFMARLQSETRKLLEKEGIEVERVACGNITVIEEYDNLLKTLDTPIRTTVVNKR